MPADVFWARGVRFHLHALLVSAGAVAFVSVLGVAAVLLAGPFAQDPPVTAGVLALCVGGLTALAGAVIAGAGQLRVLSAAGRTTSAAGGSRSAETAVGAETAVAEILATTRRGFALLPRFALGGLAALVVAYAIWLPAGVLGALAGAFVVVQVVLVLHLVRRRLLLSARLTRE